MCQLLWVARVGGLAEDQQQNWSRWPHFDNGRSQAAAGTGTIGAVPNDYSANPTIEQFHILKFEALINFFKSERIKDRCDRQQQRRARAARKQSWKSFGHLSSAALLTNADCWAATAHVLPGAPHASRPTHSCTLPRTHAPTHPRTQSSTVAPAHHGTNPLNPRVPSQSTASTPWQPTPCHRSLQCNQGSRCFLTWLYQMMCICV